MHTDALTQIQNLEGLLQTTEIGRDQLAENVVGLETDNVQLNKDLSKSKALHNSYQNHALFHPPLGEYNKLKIKISNLHKKVAGLEKVIKDKDEELDNADQQIFTANRILGWPVCRQRPLVLVESKIQSISILPEISSAVHLVSQSNTPPNKKIHRAGKKNKKPYLGRKTPRQASQEDASDDDFIIRPVTATSNNDSAGASLHSVEEVEGLGDEVEDIPDDGYPFASWYEPRQETTIEEAEEDEDEEDEVVNNDFTIQHPSSRQTPSMSNPSKLRVFFTRLLLFLLLLSPDIHTAFVLFGPAGYTVFMGTGLILPVNSVNLHNDVVNLPGIISIDNNMYNIVNLESYDQLSPESIIEVPTNKSLVEVLAKDNHEEAPDPMLVYRLASKLFTANRMPPVSFTRQLRELENTVAPTLQILMRVWGSW